MLAYLLATLHGARRMPLLALIAGLGFAAVAVGLGLGIYALSSDPDSSRRLAQESVSATAALAALWLIARCLDSDARSGFCVAADQSAAGVGARLLGRWGGAVLIGQACALPAMVASCAWTPAEPLLLLSASVVAAGLVCAWALLATVGGTGGVGLWLAVAALWVAGHLPWGAPGWGAGWGRGVAAVLPPGSDPQGHPRAAAVAAMGGLVLVALALARARGAGAPGAGVSGRSAPGAGTAAPPPDARP